MINLELLALKRASCLCSALSSCFLVSMQCWQLQVILERRVNKGLSSLIRKIFYLTNGVGWNSSKFVFIFLTYLYYSQFQVFLGSTNNMKYQHSLWADLILANLNFYWSLGTATFFFKGFLIKAKRGI